MYAVEKTGIRGREAFVRGRRKRVDGRGRGGGGLGGLSTAEGGGRRAEGYRRKAFGAGIRPGMLCLAYRVDDWGERSVDEAEEVKSRSKKEGPWASG